MELLSPSRSHPRVPLQVNVLLRPLDMREWTLEMVRSETEAAIASAFSALLKKQAPSAWNSALYGEDPRQCCFAPVPVGGA